MIIVTKSNFQESVKTINSAPNIAIDTETTGLKAYNGDRLFSIIVSTDEHNYYFNYNNNGPTLDRADIPKIIDPDYKGRIFFHNAKFDIKMLEHEGLSLRWHRIYDVAGLARIEYNDRLQLRLSSLASMVGDKKKGDIIDDWFKDQKIKKDDRRYDDVPFNLMSEYGVKDGELTLKLGHKLLQRIADQDLKNKPKGSNLKNIIQTENKLTPILMGMQDRGVKLDVEYTQEALEYEKANYERLAQEYQDISGISFRDSNKNHAEAFTAIGEKFPLTEKNNPSFTDEVLKSMDIPLARVLREYRYSYKKAHNYLENFLRLRDSNDVIHASLNQYQARTGRFSSSDPNLQNLNRGRKDEKYKVRGCFVPHVESSLFFIDQNQVEYRAMLNKAGEMPMIEQILSGLDVHSATAQLMGVPRQQAKTINFLLLYGGGLAVLARALFSTHMSEHTLKLVQKYFFFSDFKWSFDKIANEMGLEFWEVEHAVEILTKAKDLKELYFSSLPAVKVWVKRIIAQAERGYIFNDFGRAYKFQKNFAFKAPNYAIQGFCADLMKSAIIDVYNFLKPYKSTPILTVHDEIVFDIHNSERHLITHLVEKMENVVQGEYLPYTVGVEYTDKRWSDKKEFIL